MGEVLNCDLLVLGGGMAGMTAAAYAAHHGLNVLVVEKAADIGGSAIISGGAVWTALDYETFREMNPDGNDYQATHVIVYAGDEPIGTLRIRWFKDFAKFERTSFRKDYRNVHVLKASAQFAFDHVARKGFDKVITHAQPKYARLWRVILGFRNAGKPEVYFEGHDEPYIELVKELTPPANAISDRTDSAVLFRIEGFWDVPTEFETASAA